MELVLTMLDKEREEARRDMERKAAYGSPEPYLLARERLKVWERAYEVAAGAALAQVVSL